MKLTIEQLAQQIGASFSGDGSLEVDSVGPIETVCETAVTFVTSDKYISKLANSSSRAVIVVKPIPNLAKVQLVVENVNVALIKTLNIFAPKLEPLAQGIDPGASLADDVVIAEPVSIGPDVVIEKGVEIGANTIIAAGCKIGQGTKIGGNCRFDSNVVIYHNCVIGNNVIIQANSAIGSVGFGYCFIDGAHRLIPHNGVVVIEDFVEIGANTCIDRAKFGETRIGAGTKIDNLVQIAHNVIIGKCCLILGQVGIGGSSEIGDGVILAGQVGVCDNVTVGDGVIAGGKTVIISDILPEQKIFGVPAVDKVQAFKSYAVIKRLPEMAKQLKRLAARVEKLEASENDKD